MSMWIQMEYLFYLFNFPIENVTLQLIGGVQWGSDLVQNVIHLKNIDQNTDHFTQWNMAYSCVSVSPLLSIFNRLQAHNRNNEIVKLIRKCISIQDYVYYCTAWTKCNSFIYALRHKLQLFHGPLKMLKFSQTTVDVLSLFFM